MENIDLCLRSKAAPEEPVTDLRLTGGPDSPRDVRLTLYLADAARELRPLRPQPDTHCHVMSDDILDTLDTHCHVVTNLTHIFT